MNSKKKSKSKNKRTKGSKTKEEVSLDGGGRSKERVSKKRTKEIKTKEIATAEEHGTLDEACAKTANSLRAENEDAMLRVMEKALTHNHWFHGLMPRDEIEYLLTTEGDFLLRKTEVGKKSRYAISVHRKGAIKHILLNYKDGLWYMRDVSLFLMTFIIQTFCFSK
uniref:SH2 domain-containing protein n=1 Tax=Panagrolaimus davidi TaxID=227884 RepID=A0A914QK70_9BILA